MFYLLLIWTCEQGRSDDEEGVDEVDEQGRGGAEVVSDQGRDVMDYDREHDEQLAPPLMTQYMLAKFRDMEEATAAAARHDKHRKVTGTLNTAVGRRSRTDRRRYRERCRLLPTLLTSTLANLLTNR